VGWVLVRKYRTGAATWGGRQGGTGAPIPRLWGKRNFAGTGGTAIFPTGAGWTALGGEGPYRGGPWGAGRGSPGATGFFGWPPKRVGGGPGLVAGRLRSTRGHAGLRASWEENEATPRSGGPRSRFSDWAAGLWCPGSSEKKTFIGGLGGAVGDRDKTKGKPLARRVTHVRNAGGGTRWPVCRGIARAPRGGGPAGK